MFAILVVLACVAWICVLGGLVATALERNSWAVAFCAILVAVGPFGLVVQHEINQEKTQPCARYEARLMYNSAVKQMMPMRVCVERGEWMEEVK